MESPSTAVTIAAALWLIALSTQLADYATARFDHLRLASGVNHRVRLHPVAWVVTLAGLALVFGAVGVDWSARMFFSDPAQIATATLIALSTTVVIVALVAIITVTVARDSSDSYRRLCDELTELTGVRLHHDQVQEFQARVAVLNASWTNRRGSESSTVAAAITLVARSPQRLLPLVVSLAVTITALVEVLSDRSRPAVLLVAVLTIVLSVALSLVAARASLALRIAVRFTQEIYRGKLTNLLLEAERSSKKRVAGLGDRVARALSILREQQASQ